MKKNILIVDDDKRLRELLKDYLIEKNCSIKIFTSKNEKSRKLSDELRVAGFGVTVINGKGMDGEVVISWCVTPRKKLRKVIKLI